MPQARGRPIGIEHLGVRHDGDILAEFTHRPGHVQHGMLGDFELDTLLDAGPWRWAFAMLIWAPVTAAASVMRPVSVARNFCS
jgi:hypothetical protein